MANDRVLILPAGEFATVKVFFLLLKQKYIPSHIKLKTWLFQAITRTDSNSGEISAGNQMVFCGEHVSLMLTGVDQASP